MKRSIYILILLVVNASADLVATDINMSPAIADLSVIVLIVLNVVILLFSHKKVLQILGK